MSGSKILSDDTRFSHLVAEIKQKIPIALTWMKSLTRVPHGIFYNELYHTLHIMSILREYLNIFVHVKMYIFSAYVYILFPHSIKKKKPKKTKQNQNGCGGRVQFKNPD